MKKLQESGEMYLENILILSHERVVVRAVDIANRMSLSKPSVSRALKILKDNEYIRIDEDGFITLTEKGLITAEKIYDRHNTLSSFFMKIGVSSDTAIDDACRIEHVISDETLEAIRKLK